MGLDDFDKLVSASYVSHGNSAGKLVTDYKWYAAAKLSPSDIRSLKEGGKCDVKFAYNGGITLSMTVERIITETGADEAVIILSSGELREGFSFTRVQTVDITTEVLTGFSVPRSAVRMNDGTLGVYIFDGIYSTFVRIEVLREFDDAYLVKTDTAVYKEAEDAGIDLGIGKENADPVKDAPFLSQNDLIITEGRGLYPGKVMA